MFLETGSEFVSGLDGLDGGLRSCRHLDDSGFMAAFWMPLSYVRASVLVMVDLYIGQSI